MLRRGATRPPGLATIKTDAEREAVGKLKRPGGEVKGWRGLTLQPPYHPSESFFLAARLFDIHDPKSNNQIKGERYG